MNRSRLEVLYSAGIIIAIPVLLAMNTVLLARSTRDAFNLELRRKADLANATLAESSLEDLEAERYSALEAKLERLENAIPTLRQTQIVTKEDGSLRVIAQGQSDTSEISTNREMQINIAFERSLPIAQLINISDNGVASQAWNVATPLIKDGRVLAVVTASIVTTDAEEAIDNAYRTSFFILAGSILVIVALLFRHFRLVGYIQLLAKQKELNQTMSDFLSVATHELKAPTTIIKGYLSNVMDGSFGPVNNEIQEQLQIAQSQTDRMNTLVQDLLNVSRIEQGRIEYAMQSVDSTKILGLIVDNYRPIAQGKGLELIYTPSNTPLVIHADEGRIQEVFTNLIDNAIKYTATGTVTVSQTVENNTVTTTIRDTGFGMSEEARKRLFQRFYRIKTDNTKNIGGTGLGLWIIKQYVRAMGGDIHVESLEGAGSAFKVSFKQIS